ncbi:MAG: hypothetical protein FGM54_03810 [Chitinophagaceae bacterium]|nr:hypothetical protein [Chitinophagaceae bacterium]
MAKPSFIVNFIFTLVLNVLVKPIWVLLIDRQVQLQAGHEQYGQYAALMSMALMFNILLDIGLTNYNQREMAAHPERIRADWPNMLMAKILLSGVYALFIMSLAYLFGYNQQALLWLTWVVLIQAMNSMLLFLRSCIAAQHDFLMDGFLSVLDKGLVIVLALFFGYTYSMQSGSLIPLFLYAQAAAYGLAVLVALVWIIARYGPFDWFPTGAHSIRRIIQASLPYALLILAMAVYMRIDSVLLERLQGGKQAGWYAAAYRLLDMANMLGYLMAGILLPMLSRLMQENKSFQVILFQSANILMALSLSVLAFAWVYADALMAWLYPADAGALGTLFRITFSMFPAFGLMYLFASVLTAHGNILLLLKLAAIGAIIALVLQWIFISQWQAQGAAWASLIIEWGMAMAYIYFARAKSNLQFPVYWGYKLLALLVGMGILNAVFLRLGVVWTFAAGLNIPAFFLIVYAIKLWQRDTLVAYLQAFRSGRMGD